MAGSQLQLQLMKLIMGVLDLLRVCKRSGLLNSLEYSLSIVKQIAKIKAIRRLDIKNAPLKKKLLKDKAGNILYFSCRQQTP